MATRDALSQGAGDDGAGKPCAPIGRGRARDMAVNCVLPFLHALAQLRDDAELSQLSLEVYREFPKLQENELTREMRRRLIDSIFWGGPSGGEPCSSHAWTRSSTTLEGSKGFVHLHHLSASP